VALTERNQLDSGALWCYQLQQVSADSQQLRAGGEFYDEDLL
jgi:hypothetical protein